jgi:hypothetical protein
MDMGNLDSRSGDSCSDTGLAAVSFKAGASPECSVAVAMKAEECVSCDCGVLGELIGRRREREMTLCANEAVIWSL